MSSKFEVALFEIFPPEPFPSLGPFDHKPKISEISAYKEEKLQFLS